MGGSLGRDTAITNSISRCFRGLFLGAMLSLQSYLSALQNSDLRENLVEASFALRGQLVGILKQQNEYLLALTQKV